MVLIGEDNDPALYPCLCLSVKSIFSLFLQAMYMFYALAIVCDDFFVPSLEKICEVCGGTFPVFVGGWDEDSVLPCSSLFSAILRPQGVSNVSTRSLGEKDSASSVCMAFDNPGDGLTLTHC